jgi:hypothetical protein
MSAALAARDAVPAQIWYSHALFSPGHPNTRPVNPLNIYYAQKRSVRFPPNNPHQRTRESKPQHPTRTAHPHQREPHTNTNCHPERSRGIRSCSCPVLQSINQMYLPLTRYGMKNMSKTHTHISGQPRVGESRALQPSEYACPVLKGHGFIRAAKPLKMSAALAAEGWSCVFGPRIENRREQRQASENNPYTSSASSSQLSPIESITHKKRT